MLREDYWFRGVADNPAPLRVLTPQPRQSLDLNLGTTLRAVIAFELKAA
jgi:hypothetical protein